MEREVDTFAVRVGIECSTHGGSYARMKPERYNGTACRDCSFYLICQILDRVM